MKKITLLSLIAILAIGMYSCKKDDSTSTTNDMASKLVGNWLKKDTLIIGTNPPEYYNESFVIERIGDNKIRMINFAIEDSVDANVTSSSIVITSSTMASYNIKIINQNTLRYDYSWYGEHKGGCIKQ